MYIRCKTEDLVEMTQGVVHCQVAKKENKERMGVDHKEKIKRNFENRKKSIKKERSGRR
jgi:hypothetical protein